LISENRNWMGHLDSLRIKKMHLEIGLSPWLLVSSAGI
jgi:hypothetical protein